MGYDKSGCMLKPSHVHLKGHHEIEAERSNS